MKSKEWSANRPGQGLTARKSWALLLLVFVAVWMGSLFTPALMDDVDAAHAQAAQHMAESGNLITSRINGIRYIEKPPLPYWIVAGSYKLLGESAFSTHLPNALAALALAWLAWLWTRRVWGERAGLYAGLGVLTSIGPFLFTRFIIPEVELGLFLLIALYGLITGLEDHKPGRIYWAWAGVALALLTKGFIAPVFFIGTLIPYLWLTGQWRRWRDLKPFTGLLLFLLIAAPWHILCGLANPDQGHAVGNHPTFGNVHGFFYFYFVNEHFLRFFSLRYPHDYNKLPALAYWLLHLVWLFPWSLFLPAAAVVGWRSRHGWARSFRKAQEPVDTVCGGTAECQFRVRSIWLLGLFTAWTLIFFSLSSNQEYYTYPVYAPLFILIAAVLAGIEEGKSFGVGRGFKLAAKWLTRAQAVFAVVGVAIALALLWGLWDSRHLPFVDDIGTLLAHRAVADYTLSMSHFFDLTGASFAALRLPAALAAFAFLLGPAAGWMLRRKKQHLAASISVALTAAVFLIAAHIAFARFQPMLSSKQLADTIMAKGTPADTFIVFGEQSDAASVIFYTHHYFNGRPAEMVRPQCGVHGEGSTLLWGSCYPDVPHELFLSEEGLSKAWGTGERKWLFAQDVNQQKVQQLLAGRLYMAQTIADKALWTDRPLP